MTISQDTLGQPNRSSRWLGSRRFLFQLLLLFMLAAVSVVVGACGSTQTDERSGSVTAGEIRSLTVAATNGNLVKATTTGLFRSADAGQSWEPASTSKKIDWESVDGAIVNPDNPSSLYIWGEGTGVARSDDGGQTWRKVNTGLPSEDVAALAMHTSLRDTLFAWIAGQGVFRTEDGGQQWELMDAGPETGSVLALAHSPLEGSMNTGWLYAVSPDGVYLSMDCF